MPLFKRSFASKREKLGIKRDIESKEMVDKLDFITDKNGETIKIKTNDPKIHKAVNDYNKKKQTISKKLIKIIDIKPKNRMEQRKKKLMLEKLNKLNKSLDSDLSEKIKSIKMNRTQDRSTRRINNLVENLLKIENPAHSLLTLTKDDKLNIYNFYLEYTKKHNKKFEDLTKEDVSNIISFEGL